MIHDRAIYRMPVLRCYRQCHTGHVRPYRETCTIPKKIYPAHNPHSSHKRPRKYQVKKDTIQLLKGSSKVTKESYERYELIPKVGNQIIGDNNTINNKQKFNINIFLKSSKQGDNRTLFLRTFSHGFSRFKETKNYLII